MTAVAIAAPVLESPAWIFEEHAAALIGCANFDGDEGLREDWKQTACGVIERHLRAYWEQRGMTVLAVDERIYRHITDSADNGTSFEHSFHVPPAEEALALWEEIVAGIDIREIEDAL